MTLYDKLAEEYFYLKKKKKECIDNITIYRSKLEEIEEDITNIKNILDDHGTHIYEHFKEDKGKNNECTAAGEGEG